MSASGRIHDLEAVVAAVREGRALSRSDLSSSLGIRSTTISELVGDLVQRGVLLETTLPSSGRGRPIIGLSFNAHGFAVIVVSVIDRTFVGRLLDSDLRLIAEERSNPPADAGNDEIARSLRALVAALASAVPLGTELLASVFSLSGLLDIPDRTWRYTSRWPSLVDLDMASIAEAAPCPLYLIRNLDAEVTGYRLFHEAPENEATLLIHWGHGIGGAFCPGGAPVNRERGRFCEIGHWSLAAKRGRVCACGNTDCLETVAALWSLGPELRRIHADLPLDETRLAEHVRRLDLLAIPAMSEALDQVLRVTVNLCRLMFPDHVVLSGPFVNNPIIFSRFVDELSRAPLLQAFDSIRVSMIESSQRLETIGALDLPLRDELRRLLRTSNKAT